MSVQRTPWVEVRIAAPESSLAFLEELLWALDASSVTVEELEDGEAVFEPGQTWATSLVTALFSREEWKQETFVERFATEFPELANALEFREIAEQDWVSEVQRSFPAQQFGARLWVVPSWCREPVVVHMDPGQAFGTGSHASTSMCLQALDAGIEGDETVLDYGCGSGILAIAALKLGARHAWGVDIDPIALQVSAENAGKNLVEDRLDLYLPDQLPNDVQADWMVANILAGPLIGLAPLLTRHCKPGGRLLLAGLLTVQADEVLAAYQSHFAFDPPATEGEWACLMGRKRD